MTDDLRQRLCALEDHLLTTLLVGRAAAAPLELSVVTGRTTADTIYGIDVITDEALLPWFETSWPAAEAVEVVSEGLEQPVVIGNGEPQWTCIVDTIDGTRGLMYDKRSAWVLAAIAPAGGSLGSVVAAAMTEIPTTKQWASDRFSVVRGAGLGGIVAERVDVTARIPAPTPLAVRPSPAIELDHGFASFARFLPQAKPLLARFEERVFELLYGGPVASDLSIFDDQYLSTGGQFHELLVGHDRLLGDVRPLAFAELGLSGAPACHPYDCCCALLLSEAGCTIVDPWGAPLDVPLDTTTPVAWVGVANRALAERVLPAVHAAAAECFPRSAPRPQVP
ncbi:MAG: hypothetical protein QOH64_3093 [Acidimicrobiaceae bacterium]|jgi:fructose-1,6-bisphosphatase/inositol monophosphatase family enzyme